MPKATKEKIIEDALGLSLDERAQVAREIIASIDGAAGEDVEDAWAAEIERRLKDIDEGRVTLEDWGSVRQRIRNRLRSARR